MVCSLWSKKREIRKHTYVCLFFAKRDIRINIKNTITEMENIHEGIKSRLSDTEK